MKNKLFYFLSLVLLLCAPNVFSKSYWEVWIVDSKTNDTVKYNNPNEFFSAEGAIAPGLDRNNPDLNVWIRLNAQMCMSKHYKVTYVFQNYLSNCTVGLDQLTEVSTPVFSTNTKSPLKAYSVNTMSFTRDGNTVWWSEGGVDKEHRTNDYCAFDLFYIRWKTGGGRLVSFHFIDYDNNQEYFEDFSNPKPEITISACEEPTGFVKADVALPDCENKELVLVAHNDLESVVWVDPKGAEIGADNIVSFSNLHGLDSGWYRVWGRKHRCNNHYEADSVWVDLRKNLVTEEVVEECYEYDELDAYLAKYGPDAPVKAGLHIFTDTIPGADEFDCTIVKRSNVRLKSPKVEASKIVTPNGDGVNDYWTVSGLASFNYYKVSIFDRQNRLLYESENDFTGWNAVYNGEPVPSSDYWYVIDLEDADQQLKGHFSVLR